MRKYILLFLLFLLFSKQNFAAGYIHRDGRNLLDASGKTVKLNGVNLGGWLLWEGWIWGGKFTAQSTIFSNMANAAGAKEASAFRDDVYLHFIGENDIRKISELGMNVVRVPFNNRIFDTVSCHAIGWQVLDSVLSWCAKYKVYAVLDMHGAPAGQSPYFISDPEKKNLWKSPEAMKKTIVLWKKIAERYSENPWVAGYDLLNEPIPPNDAALLKMYMDIIPAIRQVDKNHLLILEGNSFATKFAFFKSLPDENMMFSFHLYTWFGGKPENKVEAHVAISKQLNVPFWCGEWGENNYEVLENTLKVLNDPQNGFSGWSFWTWKKFPNGMTSLNAINMGDDWKKFITWCCKPNAKDKPATDAAQKLLVDFEKAMLFDNCSHDEKLGKLLSDYAKN